MTFCDLTIFNDNPLLIRLCTELDLLPNFEWFPYNICDGCGMPTGDAYSSGHLVPSLWDLHMFYLLRPIFFRTCRYFTGLCSSNIPRYFLDFAFKQWVFCSMTMNKNTSLTVAERLPRGKSLLKTKEMCTYKFGAIQGQLGNWWDKTFIPSRVSGFMLIALKFKGNLKLT